MVDTAKLLDALRSIANPEESSVYNTMLYTFIADNREESIVYLSIENKDNSEKTMYAVGRLNKDEAIDLARSLLNDTENF